MPDQPPHLNELEIVQNPILGAHAIWEFGLGFQQQSGNPAILPLAFLVLPIVFHSSTLELVLSTRKASGLALFAAKLNEKRENLLAFHGRALAFRHLTVRSIAMGISRRLLTLDFGDATLRANSVELVQKRPVLPARVRDISSGAQKVGFWFSQLGLHQISLTLAVEF